MLMTTLPMISQRWRGLFFRTRERDSTGRPLAPKSIKKDPLSSAPGPFILHFNGLRVEVPSLAMSPLCRSERTEPIRCLFGRCLDTHPNGITAFHPCRGSIWLVFVRLTLLFIISILYLTPWKKYYNLAVRGTSLLLQECGKNRPDSTPINIYNCGRAFASIVSVLSLSARLVLSYGFAELCCHNTICMLKFSANLKEVGINAIQLLYKKQLCKAHNGCY